MADSTSADPSQDFAKAFGDALRDYFEKRNLGSTAAAKVLGLPDENGKNRLNSYFRDTNGRRAPAAAEILYLACTKLPDFRFEYAGYRIRAIKVNGKSKN